MNCKIRTKLISTLLLVAMFASMVPVVFSAERGTSLFQSFDGTYLISQTDYSITNGVKETQVILNNQAGNAQVYGYMATIEPGASVKFKASYGGYYKAGSTPESRAEAAKSLTWDLRTTSGQAADYEKATGETVVFASNADYYNMQTAQPCGYLIMEGNVIQTGNGISQEPYFALLKNGSYAIRDYGTDCSDVEEAISGPFYLIKGGVIQGGLDAASLAPRNSIGLKADGTVVTFLADGRAGKSVGMTLLDMAKIMQTNGVVDAIYLDGGGSATYISRHEGTDELSIKNTPSDGPERVVSSAFLFVSTAEETGNFEHASLYPKNEMYIAGSQVQFSASGVDAGGYPANIPTTAKWALEDTSFGTIDASGLFTSNGKCGIVTVNLINSNKTVGSTSIEIQEPTEIGFTSELLNLAFNTTSNLGFYAKNDKRMMNLGTVIFDWEITSLTEGKTPEQIGSFNGNLFTSVKAKETLQAEIKVSYTKADKSVISGTIKLEIGRMPEVFMDFEGKEGKTVAKYDWADSRHYPEGWTPDGPITYMGYNPEKGGLDMFTEEGPFFVDDWYNSTETGTLRYPSSTMFGGAGYELYVDHAGVMMKDSVSASYVTPETGEVRFGEGALRFDFDYSVLADGYKNVNCWLFITGDSYRANTESSHAIKFDGTPTGLGCWVYAPEGTPNFWLWTKISYFDDDGNIKAANIHFKTQEGRNLQYSGIYWDGWMYCEADLTPYAKYVKPGRPIMIADGDYFINVTFIPGGSANENGDKIPMGAFDKGTLYFDNFRVVYGDNVDDMDSPVINKVTANDEELSDECVSLNTKTVKISASFEDPTGDNATGIVTDKTAIYVDGLKQILTTSAENGAEATVTLPNGKHSVVVSVSDGFGNQTKKTYYINVSDETSGLGTITLNGKDTAVIGENYELLLTTANSHSIKEIHGVISMNTTFGEPTVTFENGYTGTYDFSEGKLTINASAQTPAVGTVAKITFAVSPALARTATLEYAVKEGTFVDGETTLTFGSMPCTTAVTANYELSSDIMIVNSTGKIYVSNADGTAPGKVDIYRLVEGGEPQLLGKTNAAGVLITNKLCLNEGETYIIYAQGEKGYSFRLTGVTNAIGGDDVTPTNVRLNAVTSPSTTQSITWFSTPEYTDKKAVVQYAEGALKRGDNDEYTTVIGTSKLIAFNAGTNDNNASLVNTVVLENLKPGTTYHYRVGDGNEGHWSAERQFTTATDDAGTSFFVIGDTQLTGSETAESPEIQAMEKIADAVNLADVDFGIQTGDFIDTAASLSRWNQILDLFSKEYPSVSIVQVLGNHEYYANTSGSNASTIFNLPNKDFYSVEYGNVYIAVINCNANVETAAKWLVEDAAKSDCTWKVLTLHQPPYFTNPKGSSAPYNKSIPSAAEAAGIDFVFSGHDHAYARTEPIMAGEVNEINGVVYYICGDLGEKSRSTSYEPENNPDFHFAKISQEYDAIYLIVNTTDTTMTVTTYNLDGTVLDTYTKETQKTDEDDPDPTVAHNYVYDRTENVLSCTDEGCDQVAPVDYTGPAKDAVSGKAMYFIGGKYLTDWFTLGDEIYHFDAITGEAHVVTVVEDRKSTCEVQGYKKAVCDCGMTKTILDSAATGHVNEEVLGEDGSVNYVCKNCGRISQYDLTFADVKDEDWFAPNIDYVVRNELFSGRSALFFDPETKMTRAEFISVIWRLDGKPEFDNVSKPPFSDCKEKEWFTAAVNWGTKYGIINGMGGGLFEPNGYITREQIVTILFRYINYVEMDHSSVSADYKTMFLDGNTVSTYADEAVSWAVAAGMLQGYENNTLCPKNLATRAEVATMIMRYHKLLLVVE